METLPDSVAGVVIPNILKERPVDMTGLKTRGGGGAFRVLAAVGPSATWMTSSCKCSRGLRIHQVMFQRRVAASSTWIMSRYTVGCQEDVRSSCSLSPCYPTPDTF